MNTLTSPGLLDRPGPGHYQGRLSATLSRLPNGLLPPRSRTRVVAERRPVAPRAERRSARQLALPLQAR